MSKLKYLGHNCLELAEDGNCLKFMSTPTVQNWIETFWYGKIGKCNNLRVI